MGPERGMVFATPPRSSMDQMKEDDDRRTSRAGSDAGGTIYSGSDEPDDEEDAPFRSLPFSSYVGHTADVLDLAWSKVGQVTWKNMFLTAHVLNSICQNSDFLTATLLELLPLTSTLSLRSRFWAVAIRIVYRIWLCYRFYFRWLWDRLKLISLSLIHQIQLDCLMFIVLNFFFKNSATPTNTPFLTAEGLVF